MGDFEGFFDGFLELGGRGRGFFRDDAVFAEDVIPAEGLLRKKGGREGGRREVGTIPCRRLGRRWER